MVVLLALLYRFVPNRTFRMGEVLPGALLAGVLIEALSLGFSLYAGLAGHFNTYGAQFGLFFLLATWLYLLSQLLLLGAVYNRFRLGQPATKGLIASPPEQSRAAERPVDVIKRHKKPGAAKPAPDDSTQKQPASATQHRSIFQRAVVAALVGLVVAGGVINRRRHSNPS